MTPFARQLVLGIAAVAGLVALLASFNANLRHQVEITLSRQPESFLELAFAHPEVARACAVEDGTLTVDVGVQAHGNRAGLVPISFEVVAENTFDSLKRTRQIEARSGELTEISENLPVPASGPFTVVAKVTDSHEFISIRCQPS